jgi:hypothetical protein
LNAISEEEKQELRELAGSAAIRDEFRLLRRNSMAMQQRVDVDRLIQFLNTMVRLNPNPAPPRTFVTYKSVKL